MRINMGQELVIGGYVAAPKNFDSIIVGYYERDDLIYVACVQAGFVPALRGKVFERFHKLEIKTCLCLLKIESEPKFESVRRVKWSVCTDRTGTGYDRNRALLPP
jgi:hypothetical protein